MAGMTQRDLATLLGKSQPWVHKSELGERRVDIGEWIAWCDGCGVIPVEALTVLLDTLPQRRLAAHRR